MRCALTGPVRAPTPVGAGSAAATAALGAPTCCNAAQRVAPGATQTQRNATCHACCNAAQRSATCRNRQRQRSAQRVAAPQSMLRRVHRVSTRLGRTEPTAVFACSRVPHGTRMPQTGRNPGESNAPMWQGRAQSDRRCGRDGRAQSCCRCGRGEPSPRADVAAKRAYRCRRRGALRAVALLAPRRGGSRQERACA